MAARTPEQIADDISASTGLASGSPEYAIALMAAREAQTAPEFKPEGSPDQFRDWFETLSLPGDDPKHSAGLTVYMNGGARTMAITKAQVRRIMIMLSEDAAQ